MSIIYTNRFNGGVGNQLFVYFYGKIFSNKFNIEYIHPGIPDLKIAPNIKQINRSLKKTKIINYLEELQKNNIENNTIYILNYSYNPTIEDYRIFKPYRNYLKNNFLNIKITNNNDLVYHLRAGDYLLTKNYLSFNGHKLKQLLKTIQFKKLYVVTNLKYKKIWTMNDFLKYKQFLLKNGDCGARYTETGIISKNEYIKSLENINSIIKVLLEYNANWISGTILDDFNFIRSFNKIIMSASTFSWWSCFLSDAKEVYTPKNWKWYKKNNKNLPLVNLEGWLPSDL